MEPFEEPGKEPIKYAWKLPLYSTRLLGPPNDKNKLIHGLGFEGLGRFIGLRKLPLTGQVEKALKAIRVL